MQYSAPHTVLRAHSMVARKRWMANALDERVLNAVRGTWQKIKVDAAAAHTTWRILTVATELEELKY